MSYLLPTALVFGQAERTSIYDRSTSVLRLSPRNTDVKVRNNWIVNEKTPDRQRSLEGAIRVQPSRLRVVAAWGGSGRPAAATGDRTAIEAEYDSFNRKSFRGRLMGRTDLQRRPFGPNVKLVFLKDKPEQVSKSCRKPGLTSSNERMSRLTASTEDSGTSSSDETRGGSRSTVGTLSPAEALTISRYSSRAMSSSYLSSAGSSRDTGRDTSDGSERSDVDTPDEPDADDSLIFRLNSRDLRSSGSHYSAQSESGMNSPNGDEPLTKGSRSHSPYRDSVTGHRKLRVLLGDDGAATGAKPDNEHSSSAAHSVNTTRTCSNELLNVISIDDDRLRYRHYSNNNIDNDATMIRRNGKTNGDPSTKASFRRRAAHIGRSKTELVTTLTTTGSSRRGQAYQGHGDGTRDPGGRQRLLHAIENAPSPNRRQQQQQQHISQSDRKNHKCPNGNVSKKSSLHRTSSTSPEKRNDSYEGGDTVFTEMNRTLRQAVENVWVEERRRSIAIFLGSGGEPVIGVGSKQGHERTKAVVYDGRDNIPTMIGDSSKRRQQTNQKDFSEHTISIASGCSLY